MFRNLNQHFWPIYWFKKKTQKKGKLKSFELNKNKNTESKTVWDTDKTGYREKFIALKCLYQKRKKVLNQ